MKENRGHARCVASGLKYIFEKKEFDFVIPMDGDGEDRPEEIKSLIEKIKENPNLSVVAKRIKRSEGPVFQFLYQVHKLITILFTGKNVNFGNPRVPKLKLGGNRPPVRPSVRPTVRPSERPTVRPTVRPSVHGQPWLTMVNHGYPWLTMVNHGYP